MMITEFLLGRIAEDEAVARDATGNRWAVEHHEGWYDSRRNVEHAWSVNSDEPLLQNGRELAYTRHPVAVDYDRDYNMPQGGCALEVDAGHIARHDPARVLAECEAKRRIVERHSSCDDVSFGDASICPEIVTLAAIYADHPDYQEAWRP